MMINKFFSMAALAIVGAVMASCSSDNNNNEVVTPPQPVKTDKLVTLTASVSLDNSGAGTRALDAGGNKTFAVGDKIAVIYKNNTGNTVKAESEELTAGGSQATFTVTLDDPDRTKDVTYIYPASMAKADGTVNYDALNEQNGTLANISSNLDCCTKSGAWTAGALPELTLENQLAICAFKVKGPLGGDDDRTSTISNMVISVSDGPRTYAITGHDENFIYVAIRPTSSATINFYASDGTKYYAKYLEDKTYVAGHMYELGLKMAEVIGGVFTVDGSGNKVFFSTGNLRANYINSAWSWGFAPNQWDRVGNNSANINITGNGSVSTGGYVYVDLFGWSTSQTHLGIHNSTDNNDYRGATFADWGSASEVTACIGTGWRTLLGDEWDYLLTYRDTKSGKHYCKAQVDGHPGVILIPDDWTTTHGLEKCDVVNLAFNASDIDKITLEDWNSTFAPNGAVFLPTTGQREGAAVTNENGRAYYWSATKGTTDTGTGANANQMYIAGNAVYPNTGGGRHFGNAVRLVYPIK